MSRKITAYRYTLEEYKAMVRERDDLMALEDTLWELQGATGASSWRSTCYTDAEEYGRLLGTLKDPFSKWQGDDADAYYARGMSILYDIRHALMDYDAALKCVEQRVRARIDELLRGISDCEDEYLMSVGDNIAVQASLALGIEVK